MVDDAINNYKEYRDKSINSNEYVEIFFIVHALFLLAELEAENSLPKILEFLSQDEEFVYFWLGDILTEDIQYVIYKLGKNKMKLLEKFLLNKDYYLYFQETVSMGLAKIAV